MSVKESVFILETRVPVMNKIHLFIVSTFVRESFMVKSAINIFHPEVRSEGKTHHTVILLK